jgi:hypothetical protein
MPQFLRASRSAKLFAVEEEHAMADTQAKQDEKPTESSGVIRTGATAAEARQGPRILKLLLRIGTTGLTVKRMQKRGRYVAEDLLEDFAHAVKKHPIRSLALGTSAAFGAGTFVGWLCSRPRTSARSESAR